MADIGGVSLNNTAAVNTNVSPVVTKPAEGAQKTAQNPAVEEKKAEEILENVISVSEDGDTVQATDESMDRLEEDAFGRVVVENTEAQENTRTAQGEENITTNDLTSQSIAAANDLNKPDPTKERLQEANDPNKPDPTKERLQEANDPNKPNPTEERLKAMIKEQIKADERENFNTEKREQQVQDQKQITSYAGYTDVQLEQLYREGEISRNDYEQEMDSRKERAEEIQSGNREFNEQMAENISDEERVERQGQELETVYSPDSSDAITARSRDEILSSLQDFSLNN